MGFAETFKALSDPARRRILELLKEDGTTQLIRRAETPKDYFATFDCFDIWNKLDCNK